ncbi:hypothetical protein GUJ93_ZPchr0013g37759 [Zizania palustris]|uniref:Uncharacterized protein n=1 Tax=Zizania palustris TaxID=103762 RepID=A0A8J5WSV7_ZIZPA|nr:hypothetical protein GUJ93_ZPchr0013g37759 [Zizania palustris]
MAVAVVAQEQLQHKKVLKASIGRRAWLLLRLAVLWARKGSAVHRLRLLSNLRRAGLRLGGGGGRGDRLWYGEREFSIDETPTFRFRTPSARVLRFIPCITTTVPDTPGIYGNEDRYFFCPQETEPGCSVGYYDGEPRECDDEEAIRSDAVAEEQLLDRAMVEARTGTTEGAGCGDAGVDAKAEEFIARFYAQMKLQRQISWLQYNEMMERSLR